MEPPVRNLIVRIVRVALSMLFISMALQNLGVELLPLVAGLGVAGAGIALAMQGLLTNLVAGITICGQELGGSRGRRDPPPAQ